MHNQWKHLAGQRKRLRVKARRVWRELTGSNPRKRANYKNATMNNKRNHIAGQWTRFQAKAKEEWGELSDSELMEINGRFEVLAKKIQEKYGIESEEADHQIDLWTANLRV